MSPLRLAPVALSLAVACTEPETVPVHTDAPGDTDTDTGLVVALTCGSEPGADLRSGATSCDDAGHCWVVLCGGSFEMGSHDPADDDWERPVHTVEVPHFEILQTEVTEAQMNACVDAGVCGRPPDPPLGCEISPDHPSVCNDWFAGDDYCRWIGARLPSEAEWEYAARSEGKDHAYPWGNDELTCDHLVKSQAPCNDRGAQLPCSRPAGHTEQGLCDMAGNTIEWVQDWFHNTYAEGPVDGSAWEDPPGWARVFRGGGVNSAEAPTTRNRVFHEPEFFYGGSGFRCTRTPL